MLLLFYDHDPAGLKITNTFRKNLRDCERGTGWSPSGLVIERFGLNKDDIDRHNLTWIENLKTGSGRESCDYDYIHKYGERKCESNALFKNDSTLEAAEVICRNAIEEYYGEDAKERFRQKEEATKKTLSEIYDNPVWQDFRENLDGLIKSFSLKEIQQAKKETECKQETELDVFVDNKYYGNCSNCAYQFDYSKDDVEKLVRCRRCNLPMRLKWKEEAS